MKIKNLSNRRIEIIPGCIVCKTCEYMAPTVFQVQEKALQATVINSEPKESEINDVINAIRNCPEHVIKWKTVKKE